MLARFVSALRVTASAFAILDAVQGQNRISPRCKRQSIWQRSQFAELLRRSSFGPSSCEIATGPSTGRELLTGMLHELSALRASALAFLPRAGLEMPTLPASRVGSFPPGPCGLAFEVRLLHAAFLIGQVDIGEARGHLASPSRAAMPSERFNRRGVDIQSCPILEASSLPLSSRWKVWRWLRLIISPRTLGTPNGAIEI